MNISIYGFGVSSKAVLNSLKSKNDTVYVINRSSTSDWKKEVFEISEKFICIDEEDSYAVFSLSDLIILSPGIPREHKTLKDVDPLKVISEIEYAFIHSHVPVIAVTGSNGKTTTVTMISEALKTFGKKVFLGGNIGNAYSNIIGQEYDFAVIEVSSFQLESIQKFAPVVSIITNITPNHMERYQRFEDYSLAKHRIYENKENLKLLLLPSDILPLEDFDSSKSKLIGHHNKLNFFCAHAVAKKLCENYSDETFQIFIDNFEPVRYRLQFLGEKESLKFFNDSKSTNIEATLNALKAFDNHDDIVLVIGGKLRQDDVSEFKALLDYKINKIIAFGEASVILKKTIKCDVVLNIDEVFLELQKLKGKIVVFSPGFPSFDQFKNFEHRGEEFEKRFLLFKKTNKILFSC